MVLYNISQLTDAGNVGELVLAANAEGTGGVLFGFFMVALFVIMLLSLKRYSFLDTLVVSSFVCFLISGFLVFGGMLNFLFMAGFLILLVIGGGLMWLESG